MFRRELRCLNPPLPSDSTHSCSVAGVLTYGIPPEDVAVAVSALERAIHDYATGKAKRAAAIREFDEKLEVAMGYMRRFDALVENILSNNSAVMAQWTVARSINRVAARRRSSKPPDTIEPASPARTA